MALVKLGRSWTGRQSVYWYVDQSAAEHGAWSIRATSTEVAVRDLVEEDDLDQALCVSVLLEDHADLSHLRDVAADRSHKSLLDLLSWHAGVHRSRSRPVSRSA